MGEHLVVNVEQAVKSGPEKKPEMVGPSSSTTSVDDKVVVDDDDDGDDEQAPLIGMGECRICHEEDSLKIFGKSFCLQWES